MSVDERDASDAVEIAALDEALAHLTSDDSVLRLSETEAEQQSGYHPPTTEGEGERMLMNMGPQHPSTHGVLRLGAAPGARARRRDDQAVETRHRLPPHRHGEDR
jgi:hypothetical protein